MKLKKALIFAFLLLSAAVVFFTLAVEEAQAKTTTVDDSGGAHYENIQDAINASEEGDTIRIFAGMYYENVVVNRTLSLIGNGSTKTTIDAGHAGVGVKITVGWVNVSGFTITESSENHAGIKVEADHNRIFENTCFGNEDYAIYLEDSDHNRIFENTCFGNGNDGIYLKDSDHNRIFENTCFSNKDGISLKYSDHNIINRNTCSNNSENGILLHDSIYTMLTNNSNLYNQDAGIKVRHHPSRISEHNVLSNNTCLWNDYGIEVESSTHTTLVNNTCLNNDVSGIYLRYSDSNTLANNTSSHNGHGISLDTSDSNICTSNIFTENNIGIYISNRSQDTTTSGNVIDGNTHQGINATDNNGYYIKATHTWWGDGSGPSHLKKNLYGKGDNITAYVLFDPWVGKNETNKITLYVDDDAPTGGNGSLEHPFNRIQDALDISREGDTVRVFNGTYSKDVAVAVEKGINLLGNGSVNTVIEGDGDHDTVLVLADGVNLSGFRIITGSDRSNGITVTSDHNHIFENNCSSGRYGVYLTPSYTITLTNNTFTNNIFTNNTEPNIYLDDASNLTLSGNTMTGTGIFISGNSLYHWNTHTIDDSNTRNGKAIYYYRNTNNITIPEGAGQVILVNCSYMTVENQTLNGAGTSILVRWSEHITIANTNSSGNLFDGIYIYASSNITLTNNSCSNNGEDGIILHSSGNNTLTNNTCSNNGWRGIDLYGPSNGNTLTNNNCSNNGEDGIYLLSLQFFHDSYPLSKENTLTNNTCSNNEKNGISILASDNNTISHNAVIANNEYGIILKSSCGDTIFGNQIQGSGLSIEGTSLPHWNTHDIENNTVNGKPLYYYKNTGNISIPEGAGQVIVINSTKMTITNQNLSGVGQGIFMVYSDYSTIADNTCSDNFYGIYLLESSNPILLNNTSLNNKETGIYIHSSDHPIIINNTSSNNEQGIRLRDSNYATLTNNTCSNNKKSGISLSSSEYATLTSNSCLNNSQGFDLASASHSILVHNVAMNNAYGVRIQRSKNVMVEDITCTYNHEYGVYMASGVSSTRITFSLISENTIGIGLRNHDSENNIVEYTHIFANAEYGIYIQQAQLSPIITAKYNWWGNQTGPYHPSDNPNGKGDNVSSYIDFEPWIGQLERPVYNRNKERFYFKIQHAVNDASEGDTIRVYEHTFAENVRIDKSLTLIGNGSGHTIIDGNGFGTLVWITADWVNLSGFSLTRSGEDAVGVKIEANHVGIANNAISECDYAIRCIDSGNITIINTTMVNGGVLLTGRYLHHWNTHTIPTSNTVNGKPLYYYKDTKNTRISEASGGVILANCTNMIVENQNLSSVGTGILLGFSRNITISNSTCSNNYFYGIYLYASDYNTITNTTCNDNHDSGIYINGVSNTISDTKCENNRLYNIYVRGTHNLLTGITAANGGKYGVYLSPLASSTRIVNSTCTNNVNGIYLDSSHDNTLLLNVCEKNDYGIYLESSHNNFLLENVCNYNDMSGIYLRFSTRNSLANNTSNSNKDHGIELFVSGEGTIQNSTCEENYDSGIYLESSNETLLSNNRCANNTYGISIDSSERNTLDNNTSTNHTMDGISLSYTSYSILTYNICLFNEKSGISLVFSFDNSLDTNNCSDNRYGVSLKESMNITLINIMSFNSTSYGVALDLSSGNHLSDSIISGNYKGIWLNDAHENVLTNNICRNSSASGIWLRDSHDNIITNNVCLKNRNSGIELSISYRNMINNNILTENKIGLDLRISFENNSIHYNNIYHNRDYGIKAASLDVISVNALYNWWGDATGAYHHVTNRNGTGDRVSDHVVFDPWLTMPFDNHQPIATIDWILPNPALDTDTIVFIGHGVDDGRVVQYSWRTDDRELYNGSETEWSSSNLSIGTYTIYFKVQDNDGLWSEEVAETLLVHSKPTVTITSLFPQPLLTTDQVHFSSTATDDGTIVRYVWTSSINGVLYDGTDPDFSGSVLSVGHHTVTLKAQDNYDVWSDEVNTTLLIHEKPVAVIHALTSNPVLENHDVWFSGHGTDDGGIVSYLWTSNHDGELHTGIGANFSTTSLSLGEHIITLTVQDNYGVWSDEAVGILVVHSRPVATISSISHTSAVEGASVRLVATGTDDGAIVRYVWTSSVDGIIYNGTDTEFAVTNLSVGTHIISLKIQDNYGIWSEEHSTSVTIKEEENEALSVMVVGLSTFIGILITMLLTIRYWYPFVGKKKEHEKKT